MPGYSRFRWELPRQIQLEHLIQRLKGQDVGIQISEKARKYLGELGYDPLFGARPLKRTIQNILQNPLARMIISGEIKEGNMVIVDTGRDGLVIKPSQTG
ncbi:unnamed protein product [marine sediment metagenome]|uniref:Clp ATPase C-terminal domain-containing protein n=1 Tax=marine sediment metagenome TaxID=412755 RepID=X1HSZ2_9ZZZZ